MMTFLLVVHILLALALIGVILMQRSEGGALGMGGGGGGFMTARGSANLLTRTTAILATLFILSSIVLAILAGGHSRPTSILDSAPTATPSAPAEPAKPAVPLSQ
ncbi:preprotein translocase subunit SecG [Ferrovibrio sp.]|uniref:preprotein translocase subunit SecG n=1 Tax=Ferrovibrio sp. TaxID=1917215 RepID=UPI000CBDFEC6|nr:preprotein translocase subunit SecG [Ferrovibrio sp.]PJI40425.1 MAG: preprotein translocase subunit SecG [Ferrovibrio sp.]